MNLDNYFKDKKKGTTLLGYLSTLLVILLFGIFIYQFHEYPLSNKVSDWAIFSTYIGGVSGALLTFITVWLLVKSLNSQNKHSTISQFESSFFELMQLHKDITARIKGEVGPIVRTYKGVISDYVTEPDGREYEGLEYIEMVSKVIHYHVDGEYDEKHKSVLKKEAVKKLGDEEQQQHDIDEMYDTIYKGKETTLGHYFRSLYHLVLFVDESPISDKQKYVDLIQAYLTDSELHILFYNAIGRHGRKKFKPLIDDYKLLENIDSKGLFFDQHFKNFFPKTYPSFRKKQEHKKIYNGRQ